MCKNIYRFLIATAMTSILFSCTSKEASLSLHWKNWANIQADAWLDNATGMLTANRNYCDGSADIGAARSAFTKTLAHWGYINGYPYQAIDQQALSFTLYYWPDKRNMTEIRLSTRIKSTQPLATGTGTGTDYQLTAAEKGIPAIEWLLYSEDLTRAQRCTNLELVSTLYLADVAAVHEHHQKAPVILDEWTLDSDVIAGRSIALNLLYSQISRLSDHLRQSRNKEGLWLSYLAEGWRSKNTWLVYQQSLLSLTQMLELTSRASVISMENKTKLQAYIQASNNVLTQFEKFAGHQQSADTLDDLQTLLGELANFLETALAPNYGILIGFNNNDGD